MTAAASSHANWILTRSDARELRLASIDCSERAAPTWLNGGEGEEAGGEDDDMGDFMAEILAEEVRRVCKSRTRLMHSSIKIHSHTAHYLSYELMPLFSFVFLHVLALGFVLCWARPYLVRNFTVFVFLPAHSIILYCVCWYMVLFYCGCRYILLFCIAFCRYTRPVLRYSCCAGFRRSKSDFPSAAV